VGVLADASLPLPRMLVDLELAHLRTAYLQIVGSMRERKALMAEVFFAFTALPVICPTHKQQGSRQVMAAVAVSSSWYRSPPWTRRFFGGLDPVIQPIAAEDDSDTLAVEGQANTTHHQ
jgi:hypothetical protein